METVLAAFVILFIILFAALTLSDALISNQTDLSLAAQAMSEQIEARMNTAVDVVGARIFDEGSQVEFRVLNTGSSHLSDFSRWDVIVQYYDVSTPLLYHVLYLPYTTSEPVVNEWRVREIYIDTALDITEVYEPDILNPDEQAIIQAKVIPSVGAGQTLYAVISTVNGVQTSTMVRRNVPPVVTINTGLQLVGVLEAVISRTQLETSDPDDEPLNLIYTVTVEPTEGSLSLPETFTQADIDAGLLNYTYTGTQPDNFEFTVSDGEDTTETHTFTITP